MQQDNRRVLVSQWANWKCANKEDADSVFHFLRA